MLSGSLVGCSVSRAVGELCCSLQPTSGVHAAATVDKHDPEGPSNYPIFEISGPNSHTLNGFSDQGHEILGTWTLWVSERGHWIPDMMVAAGGAGFEALLHVSAMYARGTRERKAQ